MRLSDHLDKGFWSLASSVLKAVYGLLFTVWLISVLPDEAWGAFYLIQATFILLYNLGIALAMAPYIKYFYEAEDRLALQSGALVLFVALLVPALLGLVLLRHRFAIWLGSPAFAELFLFVPLLILASSGKALTNEVFKATHQLKEFFYTEALYFGSNVVLITALYLERGLHSAVDLLIPMSISFTLSSLLSIYLARHQLRIGFRLQRDLLRKMARFGRFSLGTVGTSSIYQHADTYVVGLYLDLQKVALLGAVKIFAAGYQLYRQAMGLIAFPVFARLSALDRRRDMVDFYEKGIYYSNLALYVMTLGLILLAGLLFDTVLQKYPDGAPILRVFVLSGLFVAWQVFGEAVLYAMGKPHVAFAARVIGAALNLVLNIVLIHSLGIWGAVWASLISLGVVAGMVTRAAQRELPFSLAGIWKRRTDIVHYLRHRRHNS